MVNEELFQVKINKLLSEITDSNIEIQESAIYNLGEMKIQAAIPDLVSLLNNKNTDLDIRWLIVESLGKIGSSDIVEPLLKCLKNEFEDLSVRRAAIYALDQHMIDDKNLLALLRFVDDKEQDIFLRQQVKYSIANNLKQVIEIEGINKLQETSKLQETKDWLETLFAKGSVGKKVLVSNTRSYSTQSSSFQNYVRTEKSICLNNQELVLIIDCEIKDDEKITLFLEVLPQLNQEITILPPNLKIAFLSPSEKVLRETKAKEADNRIGLPIPLKIKQLQLSQRANKPFKIKISLANDSYIENFPSKV